MRPSIKQQVRSNVQSLTTDRCVLIFQTNVCWWGVGVKAACRIDIETDRGPEAFHPGQVESLERYLANKYIDKAWQSR